MPNYDYQAMRRLPLDPKIAEEISRSPVMSREQGPDFLSGWGGPQGYQMFARLPMEERLVYASILEGATTTSEMEVMTGLAPGEISIGLSGLQKRGLVKTQAVVTEEGL